MSAQTLQALAKEAIQKARSKGHDISDSHWLVGNTNAATTCRKCGCEIVVHSIGDFTEISGDAYQSVCMGKAKVRGVRVHR